MRPSPAQLAASSHLLLDVYWAGHTFRFSDDELDVPSAGGDIHYGGALANLVVPQECLPLDVQGSSQSVAVEVLLPVSAPGLIAAGFDLGQATCQVSRWCEGTAWEEREVLVEGGVSDPEWGVEWDPVRFSVVNDAWEDTSLGPMAATAIVTGANLAYVTTLSSNWLGRPYPEIFGAPGKVDTSIYSTGVITGSAAVWIWSDPTVSGPSPPYKWKTALLLAGHHVDTNEVLLATDDFPSGLRFVVTNTYDLIGQPIAIVNWYAAATPDPADVFDYDYTVTYYWGIGGPVYGLGHNTIHESFGADEAQREIYVGWKNETDSAAGGRMNIRDAVDVLGHILSSGQLPVDAGRMAAAAPFLSGFKIDCVIDAFTNRWEWIRSNILPILPVSVARSRNGIYLVAWRWDATAADAVIELDSEANPGIARLSNLKEDTSKVKNQFSLEFAYSYRKKSYAGKVELGALDTNPDFPHRRYSSLCASSQHRYRYANGAPKVIVDEIRSSIIYDLATAHLILQNRASALAMPWISVSYEVPRRLGYAEAGAVALLNDPEVGLHDRVALITGRRVSARAVSYTLLVQPRPGRDLFTAGPT